MNNTVQKMTSNRVKDTPSKTSWSFQASIAKPSGRSKGSYTGQIVLDKETSTVNIYADNSGGNSTTKIFSTGGKSTAVGTAIFSAFVSRA